MITSKAHRQRIINEYLAATGQNMFRAGEFVDWLADEPDHEAYGWFYGKDDADMARERRIDIARRMASGLRITVAISNVNHPRVISIGVKEFPAYVSPLSGRRMGGGYHTLDPDDPAAMAELIGQAAQSLRGWLARYRGAIDAHGIDPARVEAIIAELDGNEDALSA